MKTVIHENCAGFSFVETILALAIAAVLVSASSSALFTVLRLDASGKAMLHQMLAVDQLMCRHFVPSLQENSEALEVFKIVEDWTVYSLTNDDGLGSLSLEIAFVTTGIKKTDSEVRQ